MPQIDSETLAFAHRLADAAGEVIRPYFRRPIDVSDKGAAKGADFDPVTQADRGAEEALRAIIQAERPQDAILGEEFGETEGTSGRRWVLDPVDGTRAFITGHHMWGTLIALEEDGERESWGSSISQCCANASSAIRDARKLFPRRALRP